MTKIPPFISNTPDDMHCVDAVMLMVYEHLADKKMTWEEIAEINHRQEDKGAWTFPAELYFAKQGLEVINIELVDYERLHRQGLSHFKDILGERLAAYYLENTNIAQILDIIPEYLSKVKHYTAPGGIEDINRFLEEGYLVAAEINVGVLNNLDKFVLHMVLIYDHDKDTYIFHDPGLPPQSSRKVSKKDFRKAFEFDGANQAIVAFKK